MKSKIAVTSHDKSDAQKSFEPVIKVRQVGYSSRIFVNRGAEANPYLESYVGAIVGKRL